MVRAARSVSTREEESMTIENRHRFTDNKRQKVVGTYKYMHIWSSNDEIRVQCTDPQTWQILIRTIEVNYTDCQIDTRKDLADQVYVVKISALELDKRHTGIAWWLFKMMCDLGWEPMATGENWYKMKYSGIENSSLR